MGSKRSVAKGALSWIRTASAVMLLSVIVLGVPSVLPVSALHSRPPYPYYWDCNDDGYADDTCTYFRPGGPTWTQAQLDRLNAAFYHWRYMTDFDPYTNSNYSHEIFLEAEVDHLGCANFGTWAQNPHIIAIVCRLTTWHPDPPGSIPAYYRMHDADTFFNPNKAWWYGGGAPPASNPYHFQGVLTHEMGHWVRLVDLNCAPSSSAPTMCGAVQSDAIEDTYHMRTLEFDDYAGANSIYP